MPYLQFEDKERLLDHMYPQKPGELNFLLTTLCRRYWSKSGKNYQAINDIIGALECAKQEYYARIARVYEDRKRDAHGDVFTGDL